MKKIENIGLAFTALFMILGAIFNFLFIHPFWLLFTYRKRKRNLREWRERKDQEDLQKQAEMEVIERALDYACLEMEQRHDEQLERICIEFDRLLTHFLFAQRHNTEEVWDEAFATAKAFLDSHADELRNYLEPIKPFAGEKGKPRGLKNHYWRTAYNLFNNN